MVPRQGAGSDPRSEGSVRVAAGLCRLERACGAGRRAPAPPRGRRGEAPRGRAVPAAATRASAAALAAAAAGAESVAAAGRLLGVEQHLRSHAPPVRLHSPSSGPLPPFPSAGWEAAGGERCRRVLGARAWPPPGGFRCSAPCEGRGTPHPHSPLRRGDPDPRAQRDLPEGHSCAETEGCSTLPPSPLQIMEGIHGVIKKKQTKIQSRKIVNRYQDYLFCKCNSRFILFMKTPMTTVCINHQAANICRTAVITMQQRAEGRVSSPHGACSLKGESPRR
ncbi:neuronal tyrosine-phosphorylated phosphoinositide-3-kinase adapter 1-like [Ursus americanus]|uniref:neuronal tyrosine-phosphorylated phosphoinositide-3-kinase adapter 1-like n=1 Tax=Ursus americanus TaxID=9643 RepID=UPI001E67B3B0|nr:neuronal tyrosine-phosphorylated phosphoinositide-3-kinase adapter 1-like [Ursus americanus]